MATLLFVITTFHLAAAAEPLCARALGHFERAIRWEAIAQTLETVGARPDHEIVAAISPFLTEDLNEVARRVLDQSYEPPRLVRFGPRPLRLPTGVSAADFARMIEIWQNHPWLARTEAMILFGSRLNFDYGLTPRGTSDLDLLFTAADDLPLPPGGDEPWHRRIDPLFADLARQLGFPINVVPELTSGPSLPLAAIARLGTSARTPSACRALWQTWSPRGLVDTLLLAAQCDYADPGLSTPVARFKRKWGEASGEGLGKSAIILIRAGAQAEARAAEFRARSYEQVWVME